MSDIDVTTQTNQSQTDKQAQQVGRQVQQPISIPSDKIVVPAEPTGSVSKEHAPVITADVAPTAEPTHPAEVSVAPELQDVGVEAKPDIERPQLSEELKKAGVTHAKETTPIPTSATSIAPATPLGMTYEEAIAAEKTEKKAKNAMSWRIKEIIREWKKRLLAKT
jgi:hypothetical protein